MTKPSPQIRDIANRFGLKTGADVARPTKGKAAAIAEAVGVIRTKRTALEKAAEEGDKRLGIEPLGIAVVAIIGHAAPVPRYIGDNRGAIALRTSMSASPSMVYLDWEDAVARGLGHSEDKGQPFGFRHKSERDEPQIIELCRYYLANAAFAKLFRTALDGLLIGKTGQARHGWRYVDPDFDMQMLGHVVAAAREDACIFDDRGRIRTEIMLYDQAWRDRSKKQYMNKLARMK